jgi:hypothetical protein
MMNMMKVMFGFFFQTVELVSDISLIIQHKGYIFQEGTVPVVDRIHCENVQELLLLVRICCNRARIHLTLLNQPTG